MLFVNKYAFIRFCGNVKYTSSNISIILANITRFVACGVNLRLEDIDFDTANRSCCLTVAYFPIYRGT